jgi:hypothetical protein
VRRDIRCWIEGCEDIIILKIWIRSRRYACITVCSSGFGAYHGQIVNAFDPINRQAANEK